MNGYELAALLRVKVTITNAMQAADMLEQLEDQLKQKTGKKNESKSSGNKNKASIPEQRKAADDNGLEADSSRFKIQSNFYEPVLFNESKMGNSTTD